MSYKKGWVIYYNGAYVDIVPSNTIEGLPYVFSTEKQATNVWKRLYNPSAEIGTPGVIKKIYYDWLEKIKNKEIKIKIDIYKVG